MSMSLKLKPAELLSDKGALRLIVRAQLVPADGRDRFQPAGFPEVGHALYDAPSKDGQVQKVCIVDSAASMANHLEAVCMRGLHDIEPVAELSGLPYVCCVTDGANGRKDRVVVTSLTEGHRLASTYFLGQKPSQQKADEAKNQEQKTKGKTTAAKGLKQAEKVAGGGGYRLSNGEPPADRKTFGEELRTECGILDLGGRSMALPEDWWTVFAKIFRYDPNSLVHGVLFQQWNVKIPRALTAHLEALGAARVASAGVKFDRLNKTVSGQPIFAVDEETAGEIRATFALDLALVRSFGRDGKGLNDKQKAFLVAFALWKVGRLLRGPFRYRTGCDLVCESAAVDIVRAKEPPREHPEKAAAGREKAASEGEQETNTDWLEEIQKIDVSTAIEAASFELPLVTNVYWPQGELFKAAEGKAGKTTTADGEELGDQESDEDAEEDQE
jgi:CRISPR-associated protein Csb1